MAQNKNMDPPPPYTATDFHGVQGMPSSAPPGPPPPGFFIPPGPTQTVHHVVQVGRPPVGPLPTSLVCPSCHQPVQTRLEYHPTAKTHLACLILCLLQCYLCCLLPYCMATCQNGDHYCPNCDAFIGTYNGWTCIERCRFGSSIVHFMMLVKFNEC